MSTNKSAFFVALIQELLTSTDNWYGVDNWDAEIFGGGKFLKTRLLTKFNQSFRRFAIVPKHSEIQHLSPDLLDQLSPVYDLLADEFSKSTLVKLIAYRMMGHRKVKLPVNTSSYWSEREFPRSLVKTRDTISIKFRSWILEHLTLEKIGYPIEIFTLPGGAHIIFMLKQYVYGKRSPAIRAQAGDYVIDAGGGWGDTALFFAHEVGPQGKVYTFEFCPDNLEVLERNINLNPGLAPRIEVLANALWNESGVEMSYSADGPATALGKGDQDSLGVSTLSIDDLVNKRNLQRVDFIKMDIEGAELQALQGAEKTLRELRPKLAISVYHKPDDLVVIPRYLNDLGLGYEFFLDHFTIYGGETVLFASPRNLPGFSRA